MGKEPKLYKCIFINIFPPVIWENLAVLQLDLSQSQGTSVPFGMEFEHSPTAFEVVFYKTKYR